MTLSPGPARPCPSACCRPLSLSSHLHNVTRALRGTGPSTWTLARAAAGPPDPPPSGPSSTPPSQRLVRTQTAVSSLLSSRTPASSPLASVDVPENSSGEPFGGWHRRAGRGCREQGGALKGGWASSGAGQAHAPRPCGRSGRPAGTSQSAGAGAVSPRTGTHRGPGVPGRLHALLLLAKSASCPRGGRLRLRLRPRPRGGDGGGAAAGPRPLLLQPNRRSCRDHRECQSRCCTSYKDARTRLCMPKNLLFQCLPWRKVRMADAGPGACGPRAGRLLRPPLASVSPAKRGLLQEPQRMPVQVLSPADRHQRPTLRPPPWAPGPVPAGGESRQLGAGAVSRGRWAAGPRGLGSTRGQVSVGRLLSPPTSISLGSFHWLNHLGSGGKRGQARPPRAWAKGSEHAECGGSWERGGWRGADGDGWTEMKGHETGDTGT